MTSEFGNSLRKVMGVVLIGCGLIGLLYVGLVKDTTPGQIGSMFTALLSFIPLLIGIDFIQQKDHAS